MWTGEVWDGAGVAITARGQYSREDALDVAERGLAQVIRESGRLPGRIERPSGEVRVVARNGRDVEAAAWVPWWSTRVERIDRFAPDFELIGESMPGGALGSGPRYCYCSQTDPCDDWKRGERCAGDVRTATGFRRSLCDCGECEECSKARR